MREREVLLKQLAIAKQAEIQTIEQVQKVETLQHTSFISENPNLRSFVQNQSYDQGLLDKARFDQQNMIQTYLNEIAKSRQQTDDTSRMLLEKQRSI